MSVVSVAIVRYLRGRDFVGRNNPTIPERVDKTSLRRNMTVPVSAVFEAFSKACVLACRDFAFSRPETVHLFANIGTRHSARYGSPPQGAPRH
jgi:hypothetical protein